jgi:hypothetical protein
MFGNAYRHFTDRVRELVAGSFVATVNADMRVGAIEETITVTGETPIVDIQSTVRQQSGAQEVTVDTDATSAERQTSGVTVNYIQRDGGNTLKRHGEQQLGAELPLSRVGVPRDRARPRTRWASRMRSATSRARCTRRWWQPMAHRDEQLRRGGPRAGIARQHGAE